MRLASPHRLRPQVFSTSRRFDPPRACRPCFMPNPLMGLRPSELFSSHAAVRRLRRRCPLGVGNTPWSNLQRDAQRHAEAHLENISSAGLTRRAEARCPHPKPLDRTYSDPKTEARRSYGATARWCAETQHLAAAQPTSRKTETLHGAQATSGCATQAPLHLWLPAWSTQHRSASSSTGEPTTAPHPKVRTRNRQQVNPV
jgi:hypothetical protein